MCTMSNFSGQIVGKRNILLYKYYTQCQNINEQSKNTAILLSVNEILTFTYLIECQK